MSRKPENPTGFPTLQFRVSLKGYGDNMEEVWKDIAGYEGLYQVSNFGRVKSLDRYVPHSSLGRKFCKGCIMSLHINNAGYCTVNLCKDNKYKSFDIQRLVALAFIPNPNNLPEVNHKDENKLNNSVENLEWVTKSGNNRYGSKLKRQREKILKKVLQYDLQGNFIREWASAIDAERDIAGKFTGAISKCANGRSKTSYGYIWRFKEAE